MTATIPSAFIFTKSTFSLWWERSTTTLMGLAAAADLFRVFVIVLVSRFALVDSEGRFHGVPLVTFIAARIAARLAEPLHGNPRCARFQDRATPTLSRLRDGQAAKKGSARRAGFTQPAVEYSLFCPENVGYHGRYIRSVAIARVIPGARPGLQELVDVTSCSLI
jgi:hypothetical protein